MLIKKSQFIIKNLLKKIKLFFIYQKYIFPKINLLKLAENKKNNIKSSLSILSDNKSIQVFKARMELFSVCYMKQNQLPAIIAMSKTMEKSNVRKTKYDFTLADNTIYTVLADDKQYFPPGIISLKNECFLDCGAFIGDTIEKFLKESNYQFDSIFSFEPSKTNYNLLEEFLTKYNSSIKEKIKIFNCGLAQKESTLYFPKKQDSSCNGIKEEIVFENNSSGLFEKCDIKNINNVLTKEELSKITFIKMDVEGHELDILESLKNTIQQNKPKLAICVYHKPEDFFEIPLYIKSLVPEYKIYLRHHSNWDWETVCYAVL